MSEVETVDRSRSSRIFALADIRVLQELAQKILVTAQRVEILQEPEPSLVMMEVNDPVAGGSFYAGEVLLTSCQVLVNGRLGCATAVGDDEERARASALLDAALEDPTTAPTLWDELEKEERRIELTHRAESALAARTRVQFETMEDRDTGSDLRSRI